MGRERHVNHLLSCTCFLLSVTIVILGTQQSEFYKRENSIIPQWHLITAFPAVIDSNPFSSAASFRRGPQSLLGGNRTWKQLLPGPGPEGDSLGAQHFPCTEADGFYWLQASWASPSHMVAGTAAFIERRQFYFLRFFFFCRK